MAQATSHNSTRRAFLSTAASVAAAATVAPTALAMTAEDPTFALIEAHRAAETAHVAACAEQDRREQILINEGIGLRPFTVMMDDNGHATVVYSHPHIDALWGAASERVRAKAHADSTASLARYDEIFVSDDEAGRRGDVASDAFDKTDFKRANDGSRSSRNGVLPRG